MHSNDPYWKLHGGFILKTNRKKIGFTQEQVAAIMEFPLRTYQRWEAEQAEPAFGIVMAFCECVFKIELIDAIVIAQEAMVEHQRAG
jgi:transcriptional regulator with XRE-family HTH domain